MSASVPVNWTNSSCSCTHIHTRTNLYAEAVMVVLNWKVGLYIDHNLFYLERDEAMTTERSRRGKRRRGKNVRLVPEKWIEKVFEPYLHSINNNNNNMCTANVLSSLSLCMDEPVYIQTKQTLRSLFWHTYSGQISTCPYVLICTPLCALACVRSHSAHVLSRSLVDGVFIMWNMILIHIK